MSQEQEFEQQVEQDDAEDVLSRGTEPDEGETLDRGDDFVPDTDTDEDYDQEIIAAVAGGKPAAEQRQSVPVGRLHAVIAEKKELKERVAALEAQLKGAPTSGAAAVDPGGATIPELLRQRNELMFEGDLDAATGIDEKIEALREEHAATRAIGRIEAQRAEQETRQSTATVIAEAVAAYPVLDPDAPEFNQALTGKINVLAQAYNSQGMRPDQALREAIGDLVGGLRTVQAPTPAPTRTERQKLRNADAQFRQPPSLSGTGVGERGRAAATRVEEMSDDDFANLPDRRKREMRGD